MKPEGVDLHDVHEVRELIDRVVQTRWREVRRLSGGLEVRDNRGLHDFRIACKRLRYALERFEVVDSSLREVAERLAEMQDALGGAHDRDVLLAILPPTMALTQRRLQQEREECVDRAVALWAELRDLMSI
jgi:CHAD domain-containing protein